MAETENRTLNPLIGRVAGAERIVSLKVNRVLPRTQFTYVYFIQHGGVRGPVKIGNGWNPHLRMRRLQSGTPVKLRLIAAFFDESQLFERVLHSYFAESRILNEWFRLDAELASFVSWLLATAE